MGLFIRALLNSWLLFLIFYFIHIKQKSNSIVIDGQLIFIEFKQTELCISILINIIKYILKMFLT
jgi:hypothetical protein